MRTPVFASRHLGARCGADVHLKAENLQRTGSFKIRGAFNRISALDADERLRGVVAASAGNHAQGVGLAARLLGVPATICMPADASIAKVEATRGLRRRRSTSAARRTTRRRSRRATWPPAPAPRSCPRSTTSS